MKKIVITGCAGFIGFHLAKACIKAGMEVLGIDNINDYYDVTLKEDRLSQLKCHNNLCFIKENIAQKDRIQDIFIEYEPDCVIHLAAQAGVRYSIENPFAYIESNLHGFTSVINAAKEAEVKHFIYASSSSVYGANTKQPFNESESLNHPLSLYAATKKSNELIAHSYSNLYELPTTGLRFFTVYGPWGRPDMALFLFTKNILKGEPINVFNQGEMIRDFTYVDDIVEGITRLMPKIPEPDADWNGNRPNPATSFKPYRLYNIGNSQPVPLQHYIEAIEKALNKKATINYMPIQPGDVRSTYADVTALHSAIGYKPSIQVDEGVKKFVDWYQDYYKVKQGVTYA